MAHWTKQNCARTHSRTRMLVAMLAALGLAATASAQTDRSPAELTAARDLFHEGVGCIDAGDLDCAVDRLTRSLTLRPSAVVAFNLAEAKQQRGELVAAAECFREAVRLSEPGELRQAAQAAVQRIVRRLARLRVDREGRGTVHLDDEPLEDALVGVAFAVDPGEHVAQLHDGENAGPEVRITLAEGEEGAVVVRLDPRVPTPEEVARSSGVGGPLTAEQRRDRRRRRGVAIAIAIVAAGAIAAFLGAVLTEPAYPERTGADAQARVFR